MNRNSIDIFNYSIKSEIVAAASSQTHVWIILRDHQFHVINSKNPRDVYSFVITTPSKNSISNNYNIYVSPDEKSCVLIIQEYLYHYSLLTPDEPPKIFQIPPNECPKCGTWYTEDNSLYFVFCTTRGKVYQYSLETRFTNDLYTTEKGRPIYNIKIIQSTSTSKDKKPVTTTFVFLFITDSISIFGGTELLALIFHNASNKKIMAGPANTTTIDRTSMYNKEIAISCQYGILICSILGITAKGQIMDNQNVFLTVPPEQIVVFTMCKYGFFIAKSDSVEFYSKTENNPAHLSIPVPGVIKIILKKDRIWFFSPRRIFYIQMQKFLNVISNIAQKVNDYNLLLLSAPDQLRRSEALHKKSSSMKPLEFAKFLIELDLSFQTIANTLLDSPLYLISYFELLLEKNCNFSIQIAHWTAILYSQQYPKMEKEFLVFIDKYYKLFNKKMIMKILEKVNFWKGIEKYLMLIGDTETLINQCAVYQQYDKLSDLFLKTENPTQFVNIVLMLIKSMGNDENKINDLFFQINNQRPFVPTQIVPLLFFSSDFAIDYIKQYFFTLNDIYAAITIMFYADKHYEDDIIKIVKDRKSDPFLALRICMQCKCYSASSQILWRLKNPEMAIDYALQQSIATAKNLLILNTDRNINSSSNNLASAQPKTLKDMLLKRGWLRLLKKTSGSIRRDVMADVIETNLFNFEEITDYADDMDTILQYKEIMSEAIGSIQAASSPIHYRVRFPPLRIPNRPIKLTDRCVLCGASIIGKKFVIFPCKHMAHSECLKENLSKMKLTDEINVDDQFLKSCPVCGFASIPVATGTINVK